MTAYMTGFGNHFSTEAVAGALPMARNSPQRPAFGLYAEQLSGTAFTAPRADNRRSWLYRLRPTALHGAYRPYTGAPEFDATLPAAPPSPNRLRWSPRAAVTGTDLIDGIAVMLANGDATSGGGVTVGHYGAMQDMTDRVFLDSDAELLFIPQTGSIDFRTEFGRLVVAPGEIAVLPRGMRWRALLPEGAAQGYVVQNFGADFRLPELGPIGSNGLANRRDFEYPVAAFEDDDTPHQCINRYCGALWVADVPHSPLDVVAWHGNLAPYKYDLAKFNTIGTVSYDHPDASIFTVLTSPSDTPGTANADFVIFPPRWMVGEDTFRPPWFHRNVMSEAMGLITGAYDAKAGGFAPGALSLHNRFTSHGPDLASWRAATDADLKPHKIDNTMAFMVESRWALLPTKVALASPALQSGYDSVWDGFPKARLGDAKP